ncbi:MAG: DUF1385 domain-containing protein [Dissulfuribacterales bacterium]
MTPLTLMSGALSASMNVGGQAVLEGVMMRSPNALSVVVRRSDGTVAIKEDKWASFTQRMPWLKRPFLRGVVVMVESLVNGLQALNFSAQVAAEESVVAGVQEGQPISKWTIALTLLASIGLGLLFFVALPHMASMGVLRAMSLNNGMDSIWFHVIDGAIKIGLFVIYISAIGFMPEIRRVFEYHGAEHKAIHVYEAGRDLVVENARDYDTLHTRCGTAFLMVLLLVSILVFTFILPLLPHFAFKWVDIPLSIAVKILLMLPIASISYEIIKFSAGLNASSGYRPFQWLLQGLLLPGLLMQRLTTRIPSDEQVQIAMESLSRVLKLESAFQRSH